VPRANTASPEAGLPGLSALGHSAAIISSISTGKPIHPLVVPEIDQPLYLRIVKEKPANVWLESSVGIYSMSPFPSTFRAAQSSKGGSPPGKSLRADAVGKLDLISRSLHH
jgi:hypothetical protein